jgi:hypothetical protein
VVVPICTASPLSITLSSPRPTAMVPVPQLGT